MQRASDGRVERVPSASSAMFVACGCSLAILAAEALRFASPLLHELEELGHKVDADGARLRVVRRQSRPLPDVAHYKYPPVWVTAADLFDAMNTTDSDNENKTRGFVIVLKSAANK